MTVTENTALTSGVGHILHAGDSRRAQLVCVWTGPAITILYVVGLIPLAGFLPPPDPRDSAEVIKELYVDNLTGIRAGMLVCTLGASLFAPWGVVLALQSSKGENRISVLTWVQLVCVAVSTLLLVLAILFWAWAAFRPDGVSAEQTRSINDLAWVTFLFPWPPFSIWLVALGAAILRDQRQTPIFPRWSAYLSFWAALVYVADSFVIFFKTGPFAYNGLFTLYIPFVVFFTYSIVMSVVAARAINRETGAIQSA